MIPRCQVTVLPPWGFLALGGLAPPARQNNHPRQITAWHNTLPPSSSNRPNSPATCILIHLHFLWKYPSFSWLCASSPRWLSMCYRMYLKYQQISIHLLSDTRNGPRQWALPILPEASKHETGFHSDTSGKIYLRSLWKLILTNYLRECCPRKPIWKWNVDKWCPCYMIPCPQ